MDIETLKSKIDRQWGYRVAEELRVRDLKNQTNDQWLGALTNVHYVKEPTGYLFQAASNVQKELYKSGIMFCFIGGIPLQRWGEVRQTNDVDLTIFCDLGDEIKVFDVLNSILESRIEDPKQMVRFGRMYLGKTKSEIQVDISLGFTPYERRMMERAVDVDYGVDVPLHCCSAEDLVITKTMAARGQDWVDINRVIQRSGMNMNWELVYSELESLLEMVYQEDRLARLKSMVDAEYPKG
ncbi:MAG: nucleotidyl transferase AbiEii/AbiGii toxin family protein [Bacteroidetes bacterium]|nr:nucleotidyl transferase AbiEii/AbiGii toxin family protein [Bacteroidota bacterium]